MANDPNPTDKFGLWMAIGAWVMVLLLFGVFFNSWQSKSLTSTVYVHESNGLTETRLSRNSNQQYLATGTINQHPVRMLLDTGATDIVIPAQLAKTLELPIGHEQMAYTAGGKIIVYTTSIDSLTLGHITLNNLRATINPHMHQDAILLGMHALKHINFRQEEEYLILQ